MEELDNSVIKKVIAKADDDAQLIAVAFTVALGKEFKYSLNHVTALMDISTQVAKLERELDKGKR